MALRTSTVARMLLAASFVLAACGGGDSSTDSEPAAAPTPDVSATDTSPTDTGSEDTGSVAPGAASETAAAVEDAVDTFTLAVGGVGSTGYLGYFVAEGLGFVQDCLEPLGVTVEVQGFSGSGDAMQALVSGQADFATAGMGQIVQVRDGGRDALAVMAFGDSGNVSVIISSEQPEDFTVADVGDLTWGVGSIGSVGHEQSIAMARSAGLDPDQVEFVGIGGPAGYVAALETGQVDLVTVGEPSAAALVNDGVGRELINFYDPEIVEAAFPGGYVTTVMLTSDEFAAANPNITQAMVDAVVQGIEAAHNLPPEEVAAAIPDITDGHDAYWADALATMLQGIPEDGRIPEQAVENIVAAEKEAGRIPQDSAVQAEDAYTNTYVEAAAETEAC